MSSHLYMPVIQHAEMCGSHPVFVINTMLDDCCSVHEIAQVLKTKTYMDPLIVYTLTAFIHKY
jgi:hypothetical protein